MRTRIPGVRWIPAAVLTLWAGVACGPREADQPQAADGEQAAWSYEGETGPASWGRMSPEYARCDTGTMQSPVDLADATAASLPGPTFRYTAAPLEIANLGHTLQVNYAPGSTMAIGDETYELLQYHFHTPAEHLLQGEHLPMEAHLVHRDTAGRLAVVGVLIREGAENTALGAVWNRLPESRNEVHRDSSALVNAEALLPRERTNYRYPGSLTTPPCTEGVRWMVMSEPIEMSRAQIEAVREIIHTSNRPVQPLGTRELRLDRAG